jgi:hypothetical protein
MRSKLLFTILATTMLIATALQSAEIIPVWHTESGSGDIQDMEILKGGDQIIVLAGEGPEAQIQIRNTDDGELVRFYTTPISTGSKLQITPDSTRVLMINGSFGQLRLLDEQFTIINSFNFESDSIKIIFNALAIDPIRPLVYLSAYGGQYINGKYQSASKILAYNYETGEHFRDLTEFGEYEYTVINVSKDGKYFASINEGEAYLKVWDLKTMELIRDVQLYDETKSDNWCEPKDIQFSKLNNDVLFYSGNFPSSTVEIIKSGGIHKFTISSNSKTDNIQENPLGGKFIFFDDEDRSLVYDHFAISFYNLKIKEQEYYNIPPKNIYVGGKTIYLAKNDCFIGFAGANNCKFLYDRQTSIETNYQEEIIISPNPTNSFVNIELNCIDPNINYQINDVNGLMIYQSSVLNNTGNLLVDFTSYPVGVYFVSIECNNLLKTYKIVKEG